MNKTTDLSTPKTVKIFTEVAPKYEFLNSLMTAGMDKRWRNTVLQICDSALGRKPEVVLDLATGTGDVARMIALRWTHAKVIGTDPTEAMLGVARKKSTEPKMPKRLQQIEWQNGVAEKLELETASVDLVTIAFGFRNVDENARQKACSEAYRVLKPGGVFAILELGLPNKGAWRNTYKTLLKHGMPTFAGLFGPKDAYEYLAQSIIDFPPPENIRRMLTKSGFVAFAPRALSTGMTWLYIGKKTTANIV